VEDDGARINHGGSPTFKHTPKAVNEAMKRYFD
jgi:hypothetical protein